MKTFVNLRTVLFIAVCFALGISIGYFLLFNRVLGVIISSCILVAIIIATIFLCGENFKRLKIILSIVFILSAFLGGLSFNLRLNSFNKNAVEDHFYSVKGTVIAQSEYSDYSAVLLKDLSFIGATDFSSNKKLNLYVYDCTKNDINVGDVISFSASIQDITYLYDGKISAYNLVNGIRYTTSVNYGDITFMGESQNLFTRLNSRIKGVLRIGLSAKAFPFATALILGDTGLIETDLLENFRASGVAHVFAVSGLHIGFLLAILLFFFRRIRINEFLKTFLIVLLLFSYSGVCGFSASSLRACIMCSVALIFKALGLKYDSLTAIAISALILLIISPFNLFNAGFCLSFISVLGIILLRKTFLKLFFRLKPKLKESLALTLSATIATSPMLAYYFNNLSLISVITNLVFVPLVGIIFTLLFALTVLALIFGQEGVFLFIPNYLIRAIVFVFETLNFKIFSAGLSLPSLSLFFYYVGLVGASELINIKARTKIICTVVCFSLFLTAFLVGNTTYKNAYKIHVLGSNSINSVCITHGENTTLILTGSASDYSINKIKRIMKETGATSIDNLVVLAKVNSAFMSSIYALYPFSTIYYFDASLSDNFTVYERLFSATIVRLEDGELYTLSDINISSKLNGSALELSVGDKNVLVFSSIKSLSYYGGLDKNPHLLVATDNVSGLYSYYLPSNMLCFNKNGAHKDAETFGIIEYIFNN